MSDQIQKAINRILVLVPVTLLKLAKKKKKKNTEFNLLESKNMMVVLVYCNIEIPQEPQL